MSALNELSQLKLRDGSTRSRLSHRQKSEERAGYAFMTPWILGLIVITAGPMLASLYLSFTDYSFLESPSWVGLDNYVRLLEDNSFHQALRVTFEYVIISVPLQLIIALLVAMALDSGLRGRGDRKSTRLNSSHVASSYDASCLNKK